MRPGPLSAAPGSGACRYGSGLPPQEPAVELPDAGLPDAGLPDAGLPDAAAGLAGLITASRMSCAPLSTGPATNTCWPSDSALAVVFLPSCRTTVLLVSVQVSVVPSAARTTTAPPLMDWTVPRS